MIEVLLSAGVAAFIIYAAFNVAFMISIKRTSDSIRHFLGNTEGSVKATLEELKGTVENIRKISNDAGEVTADIKQITNALHDLEKGIRNKLEYLNQTIASAAEANKAGLKAGVAAGVATLMQKAAERKE